MISASNSNHLFASTTSEKSRLSTLISLTDEGGSETEELENVEQTSDGDDRETTKADRVGTIHKRKREKRLALNRASARERRKRKRVLIDDLQDSVSKLRQDNQSLRGTNEKMRARLEEMMSVFTQPRKFAVPRASVLIEIQRRQKERAILQAQIFGGVP